MQIQFFVEMQIASANMTKIWRSSKGEEYKYRAVYLETKSVSKNIAIGYLKRRKKIPERDLKKHKRISPLKTERDPHNLVAKKNSNTIEDIFFSTDKSPGFCVCAHALYRKLLHFQNTSEHSRAYQAFSLPGKYHLGNHKTAKASKTCFTSICLLLTKY